MNLFLYSDFLSFSSGCPILAREAMLKSWLEYWILGIEKEVKLSCHIFEFQILTSVRFTQSHSLVFVFSNKDQINTKMQNFKKQKAHKPRCYGIYEPCICLKAQRLIQFHGLSVPVETIYSVFANGTTQGIVLNLNPHHFNGRRVQISSPIL